MDIKEAWQDSNGKLNPTSRCQNLWAWAGPIRCWNWVGPSCLQPQCWECPARENKVPFITKISTFLAQLLEKLQRVQRKGTNCRSNSCSVSKEGCQQKHNDVLATKHIPSLPSIKAKWFTYRNHFTVIFKYSSNGCCFTLSARSPVWMVLDLHLYQKHTEGNSEKPSSDEPSQTDLKPPQQPCVWFWNARRGLVAEAKDRRYGWFSLFQKQYKQNKIQYGLGNEQNPSWIS